MPSVSRAERIAAAIAEHDPSKLYARNKAMLQMNQGELHDYAATPEKALPEHVKTTRAKLAKALVK